MSILLVTAKTKISIGAAKAFANTDFVEADFTAGSPTWTLIGGTTNLGSAGDTAELVTSNQIMSARTRKAKGVRNAGSMTLICDIDIADAGQLALIAAEKTRATYAFKVEFDDAPAGGTPSTRYFTALVMSASEQYDEANSAMKLNFTLEIDSNVVRVAATSDAAAPAFTSPPTIAGTAEVGQTLTATPGVATGTPTPSRSMQWLGDGESLTGETGLTLTLTGDHDGLVITVMDIATNQLGSAYAVSAATAAVTDS